MVVIKPAALALGERVSRAQLSGVGLQIVNRGHITWAKKAVWVRNVPITAVEPTPAQALVRYILARIAKATIPEIIEKKERGEKLLVETPKGILPIVAARVYEWWDKNKKDVLQQLAKLRKVERTRPTLGDMMKAEKIVATAKSDFARAGKTELVSAIDSIMGKLPPMPSEDVIRRWYEMRVRAIRAVPAT